MMKKIKSNIGIVSYGISIPKYRITTTEIANTYNKDPKKIINGLLIEEKSVPAKDEDAVTLAVNASWQAFNRFNKYSKSELEIGAIYVGSESHPYAVKPSSTIIAEALNIDNEYTAADLEFACKAGTAGIQMISGLIDSNRIKYGIAIGTDTAQGAPGDALEYSAAAAAGSFILGKNEKEVIAQLIHTTSFSSDTPDFWRRAEQKYPKHGERFTGNPAYFTHVINATQLILKETGYSIKDFNHVVFHMPNGKFPKSVAKILKVTDQQLSTGFVVSKLGNSYSASSLIGFAKVLDESKTKDKILLVSYGSGAGSDAFIWEITENMLRFKKERKDLKFDYTVQDFIKRKTYLTYGQYVNHTHKI